MDSSISAGTDTNSRRILVCCDTGCLANNAKAVADALDVALSDVGIVIAVQRGSADIKRTGCIGLCSNGPIVRILPDDISYYKVKPKHAEKIVASLNSGPYKALLFYDENKQAVTKQSEHPFYASQTKIALRNVGLIDPLSMWVMADITRFKKHYICNPQKSSKRSSCPVLEVEVVRALRQESNGQLVPVMHQSQNMLSATVMRVTPGRLWIAPYWREIRIR